MDMSTTLKMNRTVFWRAILTIGCLSLFLVSGCGKDTPGSKEKTGPSNPAPAVVVSEVIQRTVPIYRDFVARTEAVATVDIRARVEGVLEQQLFKEGMPVKKNQLLYVIDRQPYEAQLKSARSRLAMTQAQVNQAEARLNKAKQDVARLTPLAKEEAVPQQDLDTALAQEQVAVADLEQSKAAVEGARAAVTQAELDLGYCTIRSPIDGLIGRTVISTGNLVGRGEPTLLATVSSIDPIWVSFAISEADYLHVSKRQRERNGVSAENIELILADNSTYPHKGRFVLAERAVDIKTGTLSLVTEFPNPQGLIRPGQFGRVRLVAEEARDAILIPQRAVMEQQSAKIVFIVGPDNKVALRTVILGERYENMFIVKEGLKAGERIIVEGLLKARPGSPVSPTDKPLTEEKKG